MHIKIEHLIDSAEDPDIVILMYKMTSGSLGNYYRDKVAYVDVNNDTSDGKSFE